MRLSRATLSLSVVCIVLSTLSFAAAPDRVTRHVDATQVVQLARGVPRQARQEFDQGIVESSFPLNYVTLLTVPTASQKSELDKLLAQQQDPKSPNYHKWLTTEQYADRFGLSQNDLNRITAWLQSQGLKIVYTARARNWIVFSGTAGQIQSALRTEIHRYKVENQMHFSNSTPASIPVALSGVVANFRGLNDFRPKAHAVLRKAALPRPDYNSSVYGDVIAPGDIATIYDVNALYNAGFDGTGEAIAVMGQTDVYLADLQDFRTGFSLTSISCTTNSNNVISACNDPHFKYIVVGSDPLVPSTTGDLGEADLDIEWSGAIAKNAKIIFVNAETNGGAFDAYYYAIDNDLAPVISLSYGTCEIMESQFGATSADETELALANGTGITILNSSGDSGAAECDPPQGNPNETIATGGLSVSYPASSQYVTGVGGTAIDLANFSSTYWNSPSTNPTDGGTAKSYIPEIAWNDVTELAELCSQQPSLEFCTSNGITNAQTAQNAIGFSSTGGGASNCATVSGTGPTAVCTGGFPKPSWQTVTVPSQASARLSPDVSFLASPNFPGYIFCTQLSELGDAGSGSACAPGGTTGIQNALSGSLDNPSLIGGTSASTPVFAGILTLVNQSQGSTGLGNINPQLYSLAQTPSNGVFHTVTSGNNVIYCTVHDPTIQPATIQCPAAGSFGFQANNVDATTGYNLVTGLGSVDANNLAAALAPAASGSFTFAAAVNSVSVVQGNTAGVEFTITPDQTNGFTGTLTFTCSGLPSQATCTFNPTFVTMSGTTPATVTVNIATTAPISEMRSPFAPSGKMFYALLLPGLFGMCLIAGSRKGAARSVKVLGLILVLGCSTLWLGSCGNSSNGGNNNPGTPVGSSTITVTASTSGSSPISAQGQVTLNVTAK